MTERPILFSAPMVRAILDGRKTQTRRVAPIESLDISPIKDICDTISWSVRFTKPIGPNRTLSSHSGGKFTELQARSIIASMFCPYGQPGDRLWVRETGWERPARTSRMMRDGADTWERFYYDADGLSEGDHEQFKAWGFKRRPSIHMPRWASRITLEITAVRVERLNDINDQDAISEGIANGAYAINPVSSFRLLWESINGPGSWAQNPWVWCVSFRRIEQ